jgi:hypothetical protein
MRIRNRSKAWFWLIFAAIAAVGAGAGALTRLLDRDAMAITDDRSDLNRATLAAMARDSADLTKPTSIEFFMFFKEQSSAIQASEKARRDGYQTVVYRSRDGIEWICKAGRTMIPTLGAMNDASRYFSRIAASFSGDYDGWEAEVLR